MLLCMLNIIRLHPAHDVRAEERVEERRTQCKRSPVVVSPFPRHQEVSADESSTKNASVARTACKPASMHGPCKH